MQQLRLTGEGWGVFCAQLADAAIEEQIEVQTAFREHGARLQSIYDRRQRTDVEMARREQEMKQLQGARSSPRTLSLRVRMHPHEKGLFLCPCQMRGRVGYFG
jgi:hypothetical protein